MTPAPPDRLLSILIGSVCALLFIAPLQAEWVPSREQPPEPVREFRAAWIATVWNIDWPSRAGLSPSQQRAEMVRILDKAYELRLNAVVLQVRPEADALYNSRMEPWSAWLSGTMGVGPSDGYDPLEFAIEEAHARGMELHAWFNPFRGRATTSKPAASSHITRKNPEYILSGTGQTWLNPSIPAVRKRAIDVMTDVARRYDVDGIHLDDYFYPYPKKVGDEMVIQFDDSTDFRSYQQGGGNLEIGDWRRAQINGFVEELYGSLRKTRPDVKLGISPFGIWRPGYPDIIEADLDSYAHLAADSRYWLQQGWVDYLSPQLYWQIGDAPHGFATLCQWWYEQNTRGRHVWPGIASSRIRSDIDPSRTSSEIISQIQITRQIGRSQPGAGHIHWSMSAIMEDRDGIQAKLKGAFPDVAVVPPSPWMDSGRITPVIVTVDQTSEGTRLNFGEPSSDQRWWCIQIQSTPSSSWQTIRLLPTDAESLIIANSPAAVAVRAIDRFGVVSDASTFRQN